MYDDLLSKNVTENFHQYGLSPEVTTVMSSVVRKPAFCIQENEGTDQLCGNCAADQCLCFCYIDSTVSLLPKSKI